VALLLIGAVVSFIGTFMYGRYSETRRQQYEVRLLLRSERRDVIARLLRAIDAHEEAVVAYSARRELVERGFDQWGEPPPTRELDLLFQEAAMLADDGSELMNGIYAAYTAALMLPTDHSDSSSPGFEEARHDVREAKEQLINAVRTELGVGHWLSPQMRKALHG
jgi:hypothetical protein